MSRQLRSLVSLVVAAVFVAPSAVLSAGAVSGDWTSYRNARHGFTIAYPTARFADDPASESEDGRMLVSRDGVARLLVGAFANAESKTLAEYRTFLMEQNYAGAQIDYAPVRAKWFVLSGTRDGTTFYERVSFTCGGKLINSWALLYPSDQRRTWDAVLERIARTYSAGAGGDGGCD